MGRGTALVRVLVTGGGGFLGQALARRLLDRGDSVRTLARSEYPALAAAGIETLRGDVADGSVVHRAATGCDAIVHCAAKVGSWGRPSDFVRTNIDGTRHVLAAARAHGIRRLVYTSTPSVVHSDGDLEGADEALPYATDFLAHYPRTKAEAERLVLAASDAQLATVALRPHLVWGPGDTQMVPRLLERARAHRVVLPSGPDKLVDSTYVDNAVDAHVLALDGAQPGAPCAGRAYFVSDGQPVTTRWLVNAVLAAAGLPPVTRRLPPRLLYAAGALAEAAYALLGIREHEPPITRFVASQLSTAHWFDISAARRDLGYVPRVSIEEGLRRLAASLTSS